QRNQKVARSKLRKMTRECAAQFFNVIEMREVAWKVSKRGRRKEWTLQVIGQEQPQHGYLVDDRSGRGHFHQRLFMVRRREFPERRRSFDVAPAGHPKPAICGWFHRMVRH